MITEVFYCTIDYALSLSENDGTHSQRLARRLLKVTNEEARRESIAAETLLRAVSGISAPPDIEVEQFGKPRFREGFPCFSLTHTDNFVACAIGTQCGVDAEKMQKRLLRIGRLMTDVEQRFVAEDIAKSAFVWTAKEAFCKFTGQGFRQLKKVSVSNFQLYNNGYTARCTADGVTSSAYCVFVGDTALTVVTDYTPRFTSMENI